MIEIVDFPAQPDIRVLDGFGDAYGCASPHRYSWVHEGTRQRLTIPAGFEFDGASVPRLARIFVGPWSFGRWPPKLHDWPYRFSGYLPEYSWEVWSAGNWQPVGRRMLRVEADRLMGRVMREMGVPKWRRRAAYLAIRAGGRGAWNRGTGRLEL